MKIRKSFFNAKWFHLLSLSVFVCVQLSLISSCRSRQKTDMRSLAPAETLVYLETSDLSEMLETLTQNKAFQELAATTKDFSQLKNVQVAAIVTGFETSEKQITREQAILNFKPRFALIADTHTWNTTAASIAENQIGKFVEETYGQDVKLEKSEKRDAKFFAWTSADGRKLFAAVSKSIIYVGNDGSLLDKCLAVQRNEAENLLKNENLDRTRANANTDKNLLALGYVSPDGIAQIADAAGVSLALEASEEEVVKSFIAKALPAVLQKTTNEIAWSARKTQNGIEDKLFIKTAPEVASVLKETLVPPSENELQAAEFLPVNFNSTTRYHLQNPQIAWRSVLLLTAKQIDALGAKILLQVSNSLFEPYGVRNAETFLSAVGSEITTAQFDEEGDKTVVIAEIKDIEKLKKSISEEINFKAKPEKIGPADVWTSKDKTLAAALTEGKLILGESASVMLCLQAKENGQNFAKTIQFKNFAQSSAVATTGAKDAETAQKIVSVLGAPQDERKRFVGFYQTETRFNESGIERRTISDFGLIGTILEQFAKEE